MKRLLVIGALLLLSGCGDKGANPQAAAQRASDITKVQVAAAGGLPGANAAIKDDASGCKDKAKAIELIAASKSSDTSNYIKLWAAGMKDETCRAFSPRLPVKIDHTDGDLTCILPSDDPKNKQCLFIESKAL